MSDKGTGFRCKYAKLFNLIMIIILIAFSLVVVYFNPNEALNSSWVIYGYILIVAVFIISAVNYVVCFFKGR
jgi:membrane protein YdbS with pleckstrin-like domain